MPELKNFGTKVDAELLEQFKKHLPRTYSIRQWMETMMHHTLGMSDEEMRLAFSAGEEEK